MLNPFSKIQAKINIEPVYEKGGILKDIKTTWVGPTDGIVGISHELLRGDEGKIIQKIEDYIFVGGITLKVIENDIRSETYLCKLVDL